jgi:hypothetical protein
MQEPKIQKAAVGARRTALWLTAVALVLGAVLVLAFDAAREEIQAWIAQRLDDSGEVEGTLLALSILAILPLVAAGIYLFQLGGRSVRARRFPPPGLAVVHDTWVLEGHEGQRRGRLLQVLAGILIAVALLIPFAVWRVTQSLSAVG